MFQWDWRFSDLIQQSHLLFLRRRNFSYPRHNFEIMVSNYMVNILSCTRSLKLSNDEPNHLLNRGNQEFKYDLNLSSKIIKANLIVSINIWRCPWCNGYRRRNWTRRHEFKSWTRMIAFLIALIPLGKVWIQ